MRVLLNTEPSLLSSKTGVGYYVFNLYRELLKSGIDVYPTLDPRSQTVVKSLSKISSRMRTVLGKMYPSFAGTIGAFLVSGLAKRRTSAPRYDLYHETSLGPMPRIRTRSVLTIYDLAFQQCPDFLPPAFAQNAGTNISKNAARAGRIIVTTDFIKQEVIAILRIPAEKIDVIPLAPSGACLRTDNPVPEFSGGRRFTEKEYILYVGSVEPRKNLKVLIKAFRDVRAEYDLSLIIAGGFSYLYDDIISYPELLGIAGDVIFTRYIDEEMLSTLYGHARLFVYPSLYEGFGLPPLEAMTCGIPVIVSDIPPLREVTGNAAMVFRPGDHEELADKILTLLSSEKLRSELKQKGLRKVSEYSWEKVAASTIRTYRKASEG